MTYDYFCRNCDLQVEKNHPMKENPVFICPECGAEMKQVVTGGAGIIFRGVGWPRKGTGLTPKAKITTETGIKIPKVMKNIIRK